MRCPNCSSPDRRADARVTCEFHDAGSVTRADNPDGMSLAFVALAIECRFRISPFNLPFDFAEERLRNMTSEGIESVLRITRYSPLLRPGRLVDDGKLQDRAIPVEP